MPSKKHITIISIGSEISPFIKGIIDHDSLAYTMITNNACDFQIHHADPSKVLDYHLEFTNIIEQKAKKSIESLSIFETLGQFLDFYNPLHLSTLNYLISKYATNMKTKDKKYSEVWKEISSKIFDEEFILPLFDEPRILHIKKGEVEVPVRQYLLSEKIEPVNKKKSNSKGKGEDEEEITGIIDLDDIKKMKICNEAAKEIENSDAVIIAPTDVISFFILTQSSVFKETIKKSSGKITILSPLWEDHKICPQEKVILEKTGFNPTIEEITKLVKDIVDTIVVDENDGDSVSKLRDANITVLVEDLSSENQYSDEFINVILKSVELDINDLRVEKKKEKEGIGEKLINIFNIRSEPEEEPLGDETEGAHEEPLGDETEGAHEEPLGEEPLGDETEGAHEEPLGEEPLGEEPLGDEADIDKEPILDSSILSKLASIEENDLSKDSAKIQLENFVNRRLEKQKTEEEVLTEFLLLSKKDKEPIEDQKIILPSLNNIENYDWDDLASSEIDDQFINAYLDQAMYAPKGGIEIAFSELLTLQNNPLFLKKIFENLVRKIVKLKVASPEKKLVSILTYLAAHKPDFYKSHFEFLLEKTLLSESEILFNERLKTTTLILGHSSPISETILEKILPKYIDTEDYFIEERLRRILMSLIALEDSFIEPIAKYLLDEYINEIDKKEPNKEKLNKVAFFFGIFDAVSLGETIIKNMLPKELSKIEDTLLKKQYFSDGYRHILSGIIKAFNTGNHENLRSALGDKKIPSIIETSMVKRRYIDSLSKVGSIPLSIFADKSGLGIEDAEKMIYDMILKGEIDAKLELVKDRLFIVQETTDEESADTVDDTADEESADTVDDSTDEESADIVDDSTDEESADIVDDSTDEESEELSKKKKTFSKQSKQKK